MGSAGGEGRTPEAATLPAFEDVKKRLPEQVQKRLNKEAQLWRWLEAIPTEQQRTAKALEKVSSMVSETFGLIRSEMSDQLELSVESLFRLQMLRRLEHDMSSVELADESAQIYLEQHENLKSKIEKSCATVNEIGGCIARVQGFKLKQEMRF